LDQWDPHSVYFVEGVAKRLSESGLAVRILDGNDGLDVEGVKVSLTTPEWGERGVHPLNVVAAIWNLDLGDLPQSDMTGIGFRYKDVVSKLRKSWDSSPNDF
jgi:hypothetical protein